MDRFSTNNYPGYNIYRAYAFVPPRTDTARTVIYRILASKKIEKDIVIEFSPDGILLKKWIIP